MSRSSKVFMLIIGTIRQVARPRVRWLALAAAVAGVVWTSGGVYAAQSLSVGSKLSGFVTDLSVSRGHTVHFKIETDALAYSITIYQLGDSGLTGAQTVASVPAPAAPQIQPPCFPNEETGLVDCSNWSESASWTVPANAATGIYVALLQRPDTNGSSQIVFVVQDDEN